MKNLDKKTEFEQKWEETFVDAELAPPEVIWDRIDAAMSKEEAGYFKRKAFIFKMLAAASIAFALGIGVFTTYNYINENSEPVIASIDTNNVESLNENLEEGTTNSNQQNDNLLSDNFQNEVEYLEKNNSLKVKTKEDIMINGNGVVSDQNMALKLENEKLQVNESSSGNGNNSLTFTDISALALAQNSQEETLNTLDHIYLIPIMPRGASKVKKDKDTNIFLAGVDFSTGVFDPNFELGQSTFASTGFSALSNTRVETYKDQLTSFNTSNKDFAMVRSAGRENKPEIAYSYGAYFGFKVTKRIILQSGIAYRKANATTTTTGYIEEIGSTDKIPIVASHQYQLEGLSSVNRIPETDLRNQYEFASIPIKVGYVFLDRKVNLTLMTGISSEFFLNNRIIDQSDFLETLSSSSGEGSPYKTVYFNGTLGTMIGYTFAKNYLLMVEPGYRFAINSFTKDDFYLQSYPSSFMISFGIAYNFK